MKHNLTYNNIPLVIDGHYSPAQIEQENTEPLEETFTIEFIYDMDMDVTELYSDAEVLEMENMLLKQIGDGDAVIYIEEPS